ncbi:MAG: helix-turn-helix domain-containing protein [Lachnospiraceae bacterium]|nr:helix-turn-helix domain-containing protein [Lachnospiraceae bacterium]
MIYKKVKKLCKQKGVSIASVEKELGFSNGVISKWEKSEPIVSNLKKVADYFGVSIDYFLDDTK